MPPQTTDASTIFYDRDAGHNTDSIIDSGSSYLSDAGSTSDAGETGSGGHEHTDAGQPFISNPGAYIDNTAIVAQLAAMGDNSVLWLTPFSYGGERVDEWIQRYGKGPQRRDFCNEFAYSPERSTAFYAGGNHGAPHVLNDAWEYHLGSNTWHLLFFPDENYTSYSGLDGGMAAHVMIDEGYLQTRRHGPVLSSHTWDGLAYDAIQKRMLWAHVMSSIDNTTVLTRYAEDTDQDAGGLRSQLAPASNLWMFDPSQGRWFRQTGTGPFPRLVSQGASLTYIGHLQKSLWYANQWDESGMWLYDSKANTWERLSPNGGAPLYGGPGYPKGDFPSPEAQIRYSQKHRALVAIRGTTTWEYHFDTNRFEKTVSEDTENAASDASTVFDYDSVNDVFLLLQPAKGTLRAYDIQSKTWTTLSPAPALTPFPSTKTAGYFDPKYNAFVVYDFVAGKPWLYRYRRR